MIDASEDLPELMELVLALVDGAMAETPEGEGVVVESMTFDMPVELHVRTESGTLNVVAATPTQKIETSVLPVWHRMRIHVTGQHAG
jgi:hypothetical protein